MTDNKEILLKVASIADAWRKIREENNGQLTDDQIDFVTDITLDRIRKIIAESEKA